MKPGEIDRTTPHESVPFMERVASPRGLAIELMVFHQLIIESELLPYGSDLADRLAGLLGFASGTIMRLDEELRVAKGGA